MTITIGYSPEYLKWTGSHASPQRARLAVEHILARGEAENVEVEVIDPTTKSRAWEAETVDILKSIHAPSYVERTVKDEQGQVAQVMFEGTRVLVERVVADGYAPRVYFNPQGAKHHAMFDHSSGFCWFNDMAWAAHWFVSQGKRVAYLDWDAHHGDGVEELCRNSTEILTISIHEWGIFPGTGFRSEHKNRVMNYPLERGADDEELMACVEDALDALEEFSPDVILLAIGADGHVSDPLAGLEFTVEGMAEAGRAVGRIAASAKIPVLAGGAGGYQPFTYVPVAWAEVIYAIHDELNPRFVWSAPSKQAEPVWETEFDQAGWDGETDSEKQAARKQAIRDYLSDYPTLEWEANLTREEWDLMESEIEPQIRAEMERVAGVGRLQQGSDRTRSRNARRNARARRMQKR